MDYVREVVESSSTMATWLHRSLEHVRVGDDPRSRLSMRELDPIGERFRAVVLLAKNSLDRIALTLVRAGFEAYVRGVWLHRCATGAAIDRLKSGKTIATFDQLLKDLADVPGFEAQLLVPVNKRSWGQMDAFSRDLTLRVMRREAGSPEPVRVKQEIIEALHFMTAIAFLASIEVALLAGNDELAQSIRNKIISVSAGGY